MDSTPISDNATRFIAELPEVKCPKCGADAMQGFSLAVTSYQLYIRKAGTLAKVQKAKSGVIVPHCGLCHEPLCVTPDTLLGKAAA
jgi:hypothetical protein